MNFDIDRETLLEGIARGTQRVLEDTGVAKRFLEMVTLLEGLHVLKEGLLTADQCCALLQISRRTFDRKVAEGVFRKEEALGYSEPRFWLRDILEVLKLTHVKAVTDPTGLGAEGLRLVDLAGVGAIEGRGGRRRRQQPKAA